MSKFRRSNVKHNQVTKGAFALLLLVGFLALFYQNDGQAPSMALEAYEYMQSTTVHKTTVHRCQKTVKPEDLEFLSQSGEDETLLTWFNGLCGGTYIEMGALDGRKFSNSFVFNQGFGWKGVLIEANPITFTKLKDNRPKELALVHGAVCDRPKTVHWVEDPARPQIGGILEFADPKFIAKWWPDELLQKKTEIQCVPFGQLLDKYSPVQYFDFLSLDVEGAEYDALSTIDFNKYAFGIVVVETGDIRKNLMVRSILEANGYSFLFHKDRSDWLYNKQFGSIYKDFAHPTTA